MVELAFLLLLLVMVALQAITLYELRQPASRPAPRERDLLVPDEPPAEGEPTALHTLQHHHRFGQKDTAGIRYCRCGDRYLDGMVVR